MIGIIFSQKKLQRIVSGIERVENIGYYYQLAHLLETDLLFFSLNRVIFAKGLVRGYLYSPKIAALSPMFCEIPQVNLLRTFVKKPDNFISLTKLAKITKIRFINLVPDRDKAKINRFLKKNKNIAKHIPKTENLKINNIDKYLQLYPKILIKPKDGAKGERIYTIEKRNKNYVVKYIFKGRQLSKKLSPIDFQEFCHKTFIFPANYLVQPWIVFKKYEGNKFDIRTSVQKTKSGGWQVTGVVARIAKKNGIVTNVAQGGKAISFQQLRTKVGVINEKELYNLSLNVARSIEALYPAAADLGLDIAIDEQNKLWFLEVNFCDERYAYRDSGNLEMWFEVYKHPVEYAHSLTYSRMNPLHFLWR